MFSLLCLHFRAAHLSPHTINCHLLVTSTASYLKLLAPSGWFELYSYINTEGHDIFVLVQFSVSTNMTETKSSCNFWKPNAFKPWVYFFLQNPRGLLPRLKSRSCCSCVTSGQTAVQKQPCKMSHEKQGLPCSSCALFWPSWATSQAGTSLLQTCVVVSTPGSHQTCSAHHEQVWGQSLAVMSPSLPTSLSSSAVGWPWSLGSVCPWCSLAEFCCALRHRRIEFTLIASLRNHLSNLCGLFLLD